jgi:tetratricopeptide (TPR) repeat protein
MPLEQAEGKPADERADVYAIGAILYHLLAGEPPYTSGGVLAVRRGPPVPLDERQPGAPADLLAIVRRAMTRDPAARYPTARELAEDLRRFQAGQLVGAHRYTPRQLFVRWLRRNRRPVAVALAAFAVLLVVSGLGLRRILQEKTRAETQRRLADARRADAEDLVGYMLGDLKDRLEPVGKLELIDGVVRKAVDYHARHPEDGRPEAQLQRADAIDDLGLVLASEGHLEDALADYRAALAIYTNIADEKARREVGVEHTRIGETLSRQGKSGEALDEYRRSISVFEELHDPAPLVRMDLGISHRKLGTMLRTQGDEAGALAEYHTALALEERATADDPSKIEWRRDLELVHGTIGDELWEDDDPAGALVEYRLSLEIAEELHGRAPANAGWEEDLLLSYDDVGDALKMLGHSSEALVEYRAAAAIGDEAVKSDPENESWRSGLLMAQSDVGIVLDERGDLQGLATLRDALASKRRLAAVDPSNAALQDDVAAGLRNVGDALLEGGSPSEALAAYRERATLLGKLVEKDRDDLDVVEGLAEAHGTQGDALMALGDAAGALGEYREERSEVAPLAPAHPAVLDLQEDLADMAAKIGEALDAQGDATDALVEEHEALKIMEPLTAAHPDSAVWQTDLAEDHLRCGAVLKKTDPAGAQAEGRAAQAIVERLLAIDSTVKWNKDLEKARALAGPQR